ncbi:WD40 repeat-like protein [Eremomyces bilateralis CBS 781.70]|uniref:Mitochondrial division protein 1 n=1 Tax=Eremomyces bilateralis CBS 781.70 TaxID=1392243 RepID=A0A6G1G966_9PEZI|nr:WD40 repeat-like protein [Eremomyces bilateralis CBS 781.70]KAF1814584.1 WD40 repeat-like protein [Eremomyces bilateralis CBS 781.70]
MAPAIGSDPGYYFQTNSSEAEYARKKAKSKNVNGNPIQCRSKLLAVTPDPSNNGNVYVAEAAGSVRLVSIKDGQIISTFSGPIAPLTSVTVSVMNGKATVLAGCWDKKIYKWDSDTASSASQAALPSQSVLTGHSDFVKALLVTTVGSRNLLVSSGADSLIHVHDVISGKQLYTLKGHARAIQALALDPISSSATTAVVWSADSTRELRKWRISAEEGFEVDSSSTSISKPGIEGNIQPLVPHETSVYAISFDSDGDLWTASADKSVKCLSRERGWRADTTLEHPDFVRDLCIHDDAGWVITACRDENVRIWDKSNAKLLYVLDGHFEEVTGLLLQGTILVSISIDATIRQWNLNPKELEKLSAPPPEDETVAPKLDVLTAEEDAELAELMGDD